MLDEFSATKRDNAQHVPRKPDPAQAEKPQEPDTSEAAAEEFNRQLQEQMAALMGSMDETPEMKQGLQAIMQELGSAADPGASGGTAKDAKAASAASGVDEPFQDTIRKTMERMQASGEQATAAAKSGDPDDILAQMMKEMQNGGPEGAASGEGFDKMLMSMMEQLTNKEILYEPMKELHDKYPAWMEKNKASADGEDMKRYVEQQRLVKDIVDRFEKKDYSDNNAADREYIVERMQQACPALPYVYSDKADLLSVDASSRKPSCGPRWRYECSTGCTWRHQLWLRSAITSCKRGLATTLHFPVYRHCTQPLTPYS